MKKLLVVILALTLVGCGRMDTAWNKLKGYTGNLDRTVTLYDANGKVIKSWQTDNEIIYQGPVAAFIAKDGLNVRVAGTLIIEGK